MTIDLSVLDSDPLLLIEGDCVEVMRSMPENSVDAIVTDPPYGLEFMGRSWDKLGGDEWRTAGGMSKPGIGERKTEWPSYGGRETANPSCATCGGRMRGKKKCSCEKPEWRVKGEPWQPVRAQDAVSTGRAMQEWHYAWAVEALRVAKPGAYLVAFGGTRTWHRLMCAIEDAGWEIRDTIGHLSAGGGDATEAPALGPLAWVYGSGFP